MKLAGAVTVGGHSVRDAEIKFGLSVTGVVDPADVLTNAGAKPGDALVLTKPLGTGFVATAGKREECPPEILRRAISSMIELNAKGRDALQAAGGAHAVTDVTGFGLAGHAAEMADGSRLTIEIDLACLPIIEARLRWRSLATSPVRARPIANSSPIACGSKMGPTRRASSSPSTLKPPADS